jgi:hypothetical protein
MIRKISKKALILFMEKKSSSSQIPAWDCGRGISGSNNYNFYIKREREMQ